MSEIDALRELNELKAALSYEFWDNAAFASLVAVFIGVVGEFVVSFTPWLKGEVWRARVAKASTLILIAGLGGDIVTYAKNSAINGTIIGFLNKEAGIAYQKAEEAKERGDHLEAVANLQTLQIIDLQAQLATRIPKVEESVSSIQKQLEAGEQPQTFDEDDLRRAMRKLPKSLRTVTLMRLADPVAGKTADNLGMALQRLEPPFRVSMMDLAGSRFTGIIVCENGAGDLKVGKALKAAGIASAIKKSDADECKHTANAVQTDPNPSLKIFGPPPSKVGGTLIFVGHRRVPSP
jgi:hypothetical protein